MDNNEICVVVQGPSSFVSEIKECWKGYPIIFSTWEGEEQYFDDKDIVIFNKKPSNTGVGNVCLQAVSSFAGISMAKSMGYRKTLKWRSDMISTNPKALLQLMNGDINFLFWHDAHEGYLVDYINAGDTELMQEIWNFDCQKKCSYPEQLLTKKCRDLGLLNLNRLNFFGPALTEENDILWMKRNIRISSYLKYPFYKKYEL